MSRLYEYINETKKELEETKDILEYVQILEKDCSKIINVYKKTKGFLYRGIHGKGSYGDFIEKTMRTTVRRPRNTDKKTHIRLNKVFKEKFGWKVRDGISTSPNRFQTNLYGHPFIFFPTNRYKFCYSSKIHDLFTDLKKQPIGSDDKEWEIKEMRSIKRLVNKYTDKNLESVFNKKQGEVMFKVKKYYLLDKKYLKYLLDMWI